MAKYLKYLQTPPVAVILISFLILYLELALIRFLPGSIQYLGFFTNFVLIASFFGIGIGFLLARIKLNLTFYCPFLILTLIALTRLVQTSIKIASPDVIFFQGDFNPGLLDLPVYILLPLIFILIAAIFATLSQPLARFFAQSKKPLLTYMLDIMGSILGVVLFYAGSYFSLPPPVWFGIFSIIFAITLVKNKVFLAVSCLLLIVSTLLTTPALSENQNKTVVWSPYYKLDLIKDRERPLWNLFANNIIHQFFTKTAPTSPHTPIFFKIRTNQVLGDVLIIGAGTGQDVAAALTFGAKSVDALDIDPKIVEIGQKLHPDKPYDDPKVKIYVDDGRNFLRNTNKKYDTIIYALTDSLVLSLGTGNIRLESYLFTLEAFRQVKNHLKKDGAFVLYNDYRQTWLIDRIRSMLEEVFSTPPREIPLFSTGRIFIAKSQDPTSPTKTATSILPKDDWPFLYLKTNNIPIFYLSVMAIILIITFLTIFTITKIGKLSSLISARSATFFFLGAAFALIETKSIVQLNLLFGSTWIVNALAFTGILITVLLACLLIYGNRSFPLKMLFPLLILSLLIQYFVPLEMLLVKKLFLRLALTLPFFYLPIFFANVIFARLFQTSHAAERDFGSNILGLVAGGMAEYFALIFGYSFLAILAGGFYILATFFALRHINLKT